METVNDYISPQITAKDSLKKRYLYKLGANLMGLVIGLITESIIPRGLGPAAYGNFNFLTNFFTQVVNFFDTGTSTAFYTKLSQRPGDFGLLRFYWNFTEILSLLVCLSVVIVFGLGWQSWLWPEQTALYVWLALIWGLLAWYSERINHIVDAYGLTVDSEVARIAQRFLGVVLAALMLWLGWFSLTQFFLYQYIVFLFLCLAWWKILHQSNIALFPKIKLTFAQLKSYSQEFYDYSAPLILYAGAGLLVGLLDRWILQKFSGSVEQGFYGLSFKIGSICFLFTRAMTPLLMREFSIAFEQQNLARMKVLFYRYIPLMYTISAFFAIFIMVQADKVSFIFGGKSFQGAASAISIMAFYPIYQTYGQLNSAVFFASGQTKLYRNIGLWVMPISVIMSLWLISPHQWFGLELGALGLAIKTVVIAFIGINIELWFNSRFLHLSFWKFLGHQIYSTALLIIVAWLATIVVDYMVKNTLLAFLISGSVYVLGCVGLFLLLPSILFVSRADLTAQLTQLRLWYKEKTGK